jgi:Protein of unknown function (DUF3455)
MHTNTNTLLQQVADQSKIARGYAAVAVVALAAVQLGSCASVESLSNPVNVPASLEPGAHEMLTDIVPANGVQIYACRTRKDQPGVYEWVFVAPEATLYGENGNRIGRHYGGPHWESNDGSKIVGALKERVDAPDANAIPWLLLSAKSVGAEGTFSRVTSIQRVNTAGGVAPQDGCSSEAVGKTVRVGYSADYYFFSARKTGQRASTEVARTHD